MKILIYTFLFLIISITKCFSYIGLGPLIPFIGQTIIFLFSIVIILIGLLAYPLKLFLNKKKKKSNNKESENNNL
mgnify:CR=1 FL=1